jgi:hypothetical protein
MRMRDTHIRVFQIRAKHVGANNLRLAYRKEVYFIISQ